jgi:hypothetical protein
MHTRSFAAAVACLAFPMLAAAQTAQLKLPSFSNLQDKAINTVDITIDSSMLGMMGWLMNEHDKETAELKKTLTGLKSVRIRSYKFDTDFAYSHADVDAVRSQLSGPGWSRLVQVHDRQKNENVDISIALDNKTVTGMAIIAASSREFTIINIVGAVTLDQVARLRATFGAQGAGM